MAEISLYYDELGVAIRSFKSLQQGTGYSIYCTSQFLNHSRGKMFEATNELYDRLMDIEDVLLEIIEKTQEALIKTGVEFDTTENKLIDIYGLN